MTAAALWSSLGRVMIYDPNYRSSSLTEDSRQNKQKLRGKDFAEVFGKPSILEKNSQSDSQDLASSLGVSRKDIIRSKQSV